MSIRKETLNLVVIGPKHAGKTVYLTTLANSPQVSLSDPATIEVVSMHWQTMQGGNIPPATAGAISKLDFSFHCKVDSQEYNLDFTVPDYDGHFAETLSRNDQNSMDIARLRQIISEADGFIVFMPLGDEDVQTMEAMRHEIGSFIGILRDVFDENSKIPAPLIIAVNKWDKSPDFKKQDEDAAALKYVESIEIYKKLYEQLNNYFEHVTVIALSAYGHRTDSAKPVPGKMEPYRVTEPVMLVVQDYFSNLHATVERLKDNAPALAELLLATRPLWKRFPGQDYEGLLQETLNKCYEELREQLLKANNYKEYKHIFKEAVQSRLISDFSPTQQVEIDHLAEPHKIMEKKARNKFIAIASSILILVSAIWYLIDLNLDIKKDWHEVANAETQKQPVLLYTFINKYGSNAVSRLLSSGELAQAREQLKEVVEKLQSSIDERLESFNQLSDSCEVAAQAKQLIGITEQLAQSISAQSMRRLEAAYENSNEICKARSAIEAARDETTLEQALGLLAQKSETAEVEKIKGLADEKRRQFALALAEAQEKARIEPIEEEFTGMTKDNLNELKSFISSYQSDSNSFVQDLIKRARDLMPEAFYAELIEKIKELTNFKGREFASLKEFIAANIQDIPLLPAQKDNISNAMQTKFEEIDAAAINSLPSKIDSQKNLDDAINAANAIIEARQISLDGGLFEYRMPATLEQEWSRKVDIINSYLDVIKNGINAFWTLNADDKNAVDLDCENLVFRDARLKMTFSDRYLPDQTPPEGSLRCKRASGNRGYEFFFRGRVQLFNGSVRLTKERFMRSDLSCYAGLTITANDLISLQNGQTVTKSLSNNCPGTSISFVKSSR